MNNDHIFLVNNTLLSQIGTHDHYLLAFYLYFMKCSELA